MDSSLDFDEHYFCSIAPCHVFGLHCINFSDDAAEILVVTVGCCLYRFVCKTDGNEFSLQSEKSLVEQSGSQNFQWESICSCTSSVIGGKFYYLAVCQVLIDGLRNVSEGRVQVIRLVSDESSAKVFDASVGPNLTVATFVERFNNSMDLLVLSADGSLVYFLNHGTLENPLFTSSSGSPEEFSPSFPLEHSDNNNTKDSGGGVASVGASGSGGAGAASPTPSSSSVALRHSAPLFIDYFSCGRRHRWTAIGYDNGRLTVSLSIGDNDGGRVLRSYLKFRGPVSVLEILRCEDGANDEQCSMLLLISSCWGPAAIWRFRATRDNSRLQAACYTLLDVDVEQPAQVCVVSGRHYSRNFTNNHTSVLVLLATFEKELLVFERKSLDEVDKTEWTTKTMRFSSPLIGLVKVGRKTSEDRTISLAVLCADGLHFGELIFCTL